MLLNLNSLSAPFTSLIRVQGIVLSGAVVVEPGGVPGERQTAELGPKPDEIVDVEVELEAEGRCDRDAIAQREALRTRRQLRPIITASRPHAALLEADECRAREEGDIRVREHGPKSATLPRKGTAVTCGATNQVIAPSWSSESLPVRVDLSALVPAR
jgi:hypothetical protein